MTTANVVDEQLARRFLERGRIAVVGASPSKGNFGAALARAMREHGLDVVVVNPAGQDVDAMPGYGDVGEIPGELDGAVLVVPATAALDAVRRCAEVGVRRVWFFQGLGGQGAVSEDAVAEAQRRGMDVIAGACPLMFLEPVGWFHRLHRSARRRRGALVRIG